MKVLATIISICLALFFLSSGCSKEEQTPVQETRVKKPIKIPVLEEDETQSAVEELKPKLEEAEEEVKEVEVKETTAIEEKIIKPLESITKKKETAKEVEAGYYIVKKGDSLSRISGRKDVYGDPLKWPILYRFNIEKLGNLPLGKNFPNRGLPDSVEKLKLVAPDEARVNLKKRANNLWVVNVLSTSSKKGKIVKDAVKLIRKGYPVYITSARVKGKEWLRLRVGFFKNKSDALKAGKKMKAVLNLTDSWAAKIRKEELEEYGSY